MTARHVILGTGLSLLSGVASAKPIPELTRFIDGELTKIERGLAESGQSIDVRGPGATYGDFNWSLFRLRIQAEFGWSVGVGNISLVPEVELVWE